MVGIESLLASGGWLSAAVLALAFVGAALAAFVQAKARRAAERRLQSAIDGIRAGYALYDRQDRLVAWNPAFTAMCRELDIEPQRGSPRSALVSGFEEGAPSVETEWTEKVTLRPDGWFAHQRRTPDGRWLNLETGAATSEGSVAILSDVTLIKTQSQVLAEAREDARVADRSKAEFLANMSHETRTPLNGIGPVAEVLAMTELNPRQADLVQMIIQSAQRLTKLFDDVLELAGMSSAKALMVKERFNLAELVRGVADFYRPDAQRAGLWFKLAIDESCDFEVEGDPMRLQQILHNLVSNAVKFTRWGEVEVAVVRRGSGSQFTLVVRDTGVGFEPTAKDRIFSWFEQADGSITRRYEGAGLGLAISRECARLMGAELHCDSVPGHGSIFTLDVELAVTGPGQAKPANPEAPAAVAPLITVEAPMSVHAATPPVSAAIASPGPEALRPLRVLIVDDNAANRMVLEAMVSRLSAEQVSVEDGLRAVEACQTQDFDVVLMDVQMPGMDGLTATRRIREQEKLRGGRRAQILVVSADALPQHAAAARAAGADGHVPKPVSAAALFGAMAQLDRGHLAA